MEGLVKLNRSLKCEIERTAKDAENNSYFSQYQEAITENRT